MTRETMMKSGTPISVELGGNYYILMGGDIPTEIRCGKGTDTWSNLECLKHSMGLIPIRQKITAMPILGNSMIQ